MYQNEMLGSEDVIMESSFVHYFQQFFPSVSAFCGKMLDVFIFLFYLVLKIAQCIFYRELFILFYVTLLWTLQLSMVQDMSLQYCSSGWFKIFMETLDKQTYLCVCHSLVLFCFLIKDDSRMFTADSSVLTESLFFLEVSLDVHLHTSIWYVHVIFLPFQL